MDIQHDMTFECNMCAWKLEVDKDIWKQGSQEEVFAFIGEKIGVHAETIHSLPLYIYLSENIIHDYDMELISIEEE